MGTRTVEGLAALCLVANGFRAEGFAEDRLRDGRITDITTRFEGGKFVVRVFSGGATDYYAKGESTIDEQDARAQAFQAFYGHELTQLAIASRPGDAVQIEGPCF